MLRVEPGRSHRALYGGSGHRRACPTLGAALYIAIGWIALAFSPTLWRELGVISFSLLVLGGIVYSLGAVVYSARRPDPAPAVFGFHEVFHGLVIAAGLLFYAAVVRVVLTA